MAGRLPGSVCGHKQREHLVGLDADGLNSLAPSPKAQPQGAPPNQGKLDTAEDLLKEMFDPRTKDLEATFNVPLGELGGPFEFGWLAVVIELGITPFALTHEKHPTKLGGEGPKEIKLAVEHELAKSSGEHKGKEKEAARTVGVSINASAIKAASTKCKTKKKATALLKPFEVAIKKEWEGEAKGKGKAVKVAGSGSVVAGRYPMQLTFGVACVYAVRKKSVRQYWENVEFKWEYKFSVGPSKKALYALLEEEEAGEGLEFVAEIVSEVGASGVASFFGIVLVSLAIPILTFVGMFQAEKAGKLQAACRAFAMGYLGNVFVHYDKTRDILEIGGLRVGQRHACQDRRGRRQAVADAQKIHRGKTADVDLVRYRNLLFCSTKAGISGKSRKRSVGKNTRKPPSRQRSP